MNIFDGLKLASGQERLTELDSRVDEVREYIISRFQKAYELNDPGHRIKHFNEVEETATLINERLHLGQSPYMIMIAAYFHDLFSWSRHNHHILSSEWILSTDETCVVVMPPDCRTTVAQGCFHHRASGVGDFPNIFSQLICSADRGTPTNPEQLLGRAIQFRASNSPELTHSEVIEKSVSHIIEKFGSHGYARFPDLYLQAFGTELSEQRKAVDSLKFEPETGTVTYLDHIATRRLNFKWSDNK